MCMQTNFGGKKDKSYKIRDKKNCSIKGLEDDFFNDNNFFNEDKKDESQKNKTSNFKS